MFIDEIKIYARAGHGGKGCVAFQREKYRPKGGPSGGNGGRGGSVILEADHDLNNLVAQYYQARLLAQDGEFGMGNGMDGHAGKDLLVKVPCGTMVWQLESPEPAPEIGGDETETAATTFKVSASQRGRFRTTTGGRGLEVDLAADDEGNFLLELRIIADVGLVGYPNAGKSTLLTAISHARPKVAPYPFTTLHPQIGIVEYSDFFRLTVCDVPGLIEGAHRNVGLGHEFLRHIERCKVLVILLDMAGADGRAPWDDYSNLLKELELYDPALLERPRLVGANKMDEAVAEENLKKFKRRVRKTPVLSIAAAFDEGVEGFKKKIREAVAETAGASMLEKRSD